MLWSLEKVRKYQCFFFESWRTVRRHCTRYLGLDPPFDLNVHTGTAGTGSDILNTNHMFPNPVGPFTYPPTSLRLKFQNLFSLVRTWCMVFWEAYPPVFFLRGCAWMSVPDNNTENHVVVLRELSWLPGNKLARFSAAETLEPAPVNLENVTQKLHSMKTPPGKTQSRRVSHTLWFTIAGISPAGGLSSRPPPKTKSST